MKKNRHFSPLPLQAALATVLIAFAAGAQPAPQVSFNRDVRPIMSETCFKCHGPGTHKAGLRLDIREQALKPLESKATPIIPGKPDQSEIIRRVFTDDEDDLMPPPKSHKVLTPEQKQTLKRWVAQGAIYEQPWSFVPPRKVEPPKIAGDTTLINPIDDFIADRLKHEGLSMSPQADRPTLIRRVAFALTGLPPTLAELDTFLGDKSPGAYERMVDRYLASPRYGEEMARHWLDVARYGDTHGRHLDNEREMWPYRDWVINSFNANKPFDQFTIEQIAGDQIPNAKPQQIVGTGFLRCGVTTGEGGSINEECLFDYAIDRTNTVGEAFLGLTFGCAVCHDHKFDPITAKDYYSLYAFFNSAADPALDGNALLTAPTIKLASADQEKQLAALDARASQLQKTLDEKLAAVAYTDPADILPAQIAKVTDDIWFEDHIPAGAKITASPGHPPLFITAATGKVFSGKRALKRVDAGLAQDVIENTPPLTIPADAKLFAYVYLDPKNPPKTLMLQYFKNGWEHRAVWGDYDAINWGRPHTTERVSAGPLPKTGEWTRLEFPAAKLALSAGDAITGFAFTQFGGTVYWDHAGVSGRNDPAADARHSFHAWWKQGTGIDTPGLATDLNKIRKAGPDKHPSANKQKQLRTYYLQNVNTDARAQFEPALKELAETKKQRTDLDKSIPASFIFHDLDKPRDSFVMLRGQYNKPGEKVEPNTPHFLPALKKSDPKRASRLDLAKWLVSPDQPLTARVTVNRFWQQFFGTGIVKTSFDFGAQGEPPSHPELLDWLAVDFRENGWDVKRLVKQIVCSATFRQDSAVTPELQQRDPENRLYARGPRFRLGAEEIRDNALYVSGLINLDMGGHAAKTYQPPNIWEPVGFVGSNTRDYKQDHGQALYRRSIYVFLKRTAPPPFMSNFDAPSRESFCTRRERSNTPLQALQLMNDVQQFEAARALAQRMLTQAGATPTGRLNFAYRTVLSREPTAEETTVLLDALKKFTEKYQHDPAAAKLAIHHGESAPNPDLPEPELASYTLLANLILNLDETLNRN
jgi:hypothetical protein